MTSQYSPVANIMVVDDTVENLRLLASILDEQGYEVRPVTNGRQALEAVEYDPPDLILLDINMPDMNGYEVCRRLKERDDLKDVPVIFLTSLTDTADKVKAFEAGGVDYITKPFQIEEVLARVKTHVALRRAGAELSRNYKCLKDLEQSRDNLVQMIVHDMRSPLMGLKIMLNLLEAKLPAEVREEGTDYLRIAVEIADAICGLTNDLLDVSRLEEGKMPIDRTLCDLAKIAKDVGIELAGLDAKRTIQLDVPDKAEASCDGAILRRVLENLISNGIKHTPAGSRLVVSIAAGDESVHVSVQDEGPGIPLEARTKIFEKFGTVETNKDQIYHSVGLGLAFCKLAVEAHGGKIGVDVGEQGGSVFWFELPA